MLGSLGFTLEITRWTSQLAGCNHRPRFSRAEANRASERPGCNRERTCSTNLEPDRGSELLEVEYDRCVSPVGDAGAAALGQLEGVLQLLNGIGVPATTGPVLPSQLKKRRVIKRVLAERERHLLHHKLKEIYHL